TITENMETSDTNNSANTPDSNRLAAVTDSEKIDLSYLKQIAEGNDAFIIEMIEMFLQKTPEALEKMNESFQEQNWEELRHIAHRIKPSYSYIGLPEVQLVLSEIESCSHAKTDLEKIPGMMLRVRQTSQTAFKDLEQELN